MLEKYFCGSPWIHMRIGHNGDYSFCRWSRKYDNGNIFNIKDITPLEYFQKNMSSIRQQMLNGEKILACESCYVMEKHGKISGRQKQLLKIGVMQENFKKSLLSSPLIDSIKKSHVEKGNVELMPVDWQIDLGNYCNSACIMCSPQYSSRLATEWFNHGFIKNPHNNWNWTQDEKLLETFINCLRQTKNLQYLHFLGGETLITPAFKKILSELIKEGLSNSIIIGFTTNLTVWPTEVIELLTCFKNVHAGLSIETLNSVNDYIRWPSKISNVKENLQRFINLGKKKNWFLSLRITPSLFSVLYLDEIYRFAIDHGLGVESCNFIHRPRYLMLDLLPDDLRTVSIQKLKNILTEFHTVRSTKQIINVRKKEVITDTILEDINSVINYLETTEVITTEYNNLLKFIKKLESVRKNKIIEHAVEYENFLRTIGY